MGTEEMIALAGEDGGPLCLALPIAGGTGQRLSVPVFLRESHCPRFVRLQVVCGEDRADRVLVHWDGNVLGEISAYLAEQRQIEMELPVPERAEFGRGEHVLEFSTDSATGSRRGLTLRALVVPADDEEPSWQHREAPEVQYYNVTCHADFAWGYARAWHEARYVEGICAALDIMRVHPGYRFQLETKLQQLDPFFQWARENDPARIDELRDRISEGRMEVICALSNPRISEVYGETLVRNMTLGRAFYGDFVPGHRQIVYDAVDVMPGCSQIPQLCTLAGYRYYVFTRPMGRQVIFKWRGLDGSTIIAARSGYSVGHDQGRLTSACAQLYHPPVERVMIGGDDQVPDPRVAAEAETWAPDKRRMSTLTAFLDAAAVYADKFDTLGPVLDSLSVVFMGGVQGEHNLYLRNNCLEDLLLACETAELALAPDTSEALPGPPLTQLWSHLLATTGHALCHILADDFAERSEAVSRTESEIRARLSAALRALAETSSHRGPDAVPVVVANRLGWKRSGVASVAVPPGQWRITDREGRIVPCQALADGRLEFAAADVPSAGYAVFHLVPGRNAPRGPEWRRDDAPIANESWEARIGDQGGLHLRPQMGGGAGQTESLFGSGAGCVVFRTASEPERDWILNGPLGEAVSWEFEPGSVCTRRGELKEEIASVASIGSTTIRRVIRLVRGVQRIELDFEIDAVDRRDGVFRVAVPFDFDGRMVAGIPFGVEPRERFDEEVFRGEFFVQGYPNAFYASRWVDYSGADRGVTFVAPHGAFTGYDFDPTTRTLEFALLRQRSTAATHRGTGTPHMLGLGRHRFTVALVPHDGAWENAGTFRDAFELHNPLAAEIGRGGDRNGGEAETGTKWAAVKVAPGTVVLSAARWASSREWEVRVYESVGRKVEARLRFPRRLRSAVLTDFMGKPLAGATAVTVEGKTARFVIRPWQIATLCVSFA